MVLGIAVLGLASLLTWRFFRKNLYYAGPRSDHFDGRRFFGASRGHDFWDFLKWRLQEDTSTWPEFEANALQDVPPGRVEGEALRVCWVGHSTFFIQTQGLNILLDPFFSDRASPVAWGGPRRVHPPGIFIKDLPTVDVILVSHNHYDHLDLESLRQLWQRDKPRIIAPLGNETIIRRADPNIVVESYDWGAGTFLGNAVELTLEPAQHWSARSLFDQNHALWASFVLRTPGGNCYLMGDSGYGTGAHYRQALEKYKNFRFAILPIGAFQPRWFMAYSHMNPEEALQAYHDLGCPYSVSSHYGTVKLAYDGYEEPLLMLKGLLENSAAAQRFRPLGIGEHWFVPQDNA